MPFAALAAGAQDDNVVALCRELLAVRRVRLGSLSAIQNVIALSFVRPLLVRA
jgi:hypothetical protein